MLLSEWWNAGNSEKYEGVNLNSLLCERENLVVIEDVERDQVCVVGAYDIDPAIVITSVDDLNKLDFINLLNRRDRAYVEAQRTFKPNMNFEEEEEINSRRYLGKLGITEGIEEIKSQINYYEPDDEKMCKDPYVLVMNRQDFIDAIIPIIVDQSKQCITKIGDLEKIIFTKVVEGEKVFQPKFHHYLSMHTEYWYASEEFVLREDTKTPIDYDFVSTILLKGLGDELAVEVLYELMMIILFMKNLKMARADITKAMKDAYIKGRSMFDAVSKLEVYSEVVGVDINE